MLDDEPAEELTRGEALWQEARSAETARRPPPARVIAPPPPPRVFSPPPAPIYTGESLPEWSPNDFRWGQTKPGWAVELERAEQDPFFAWGEGSHIMDTA